MIYWSKTPNLDEWMSMDELTPHRFCCALCGGNLVASDIVKLDHTLEFGVSYLCDNPRCGALGIRAFMAVFEIPPSIASGSPMTQEQAQEGREAINGGSGQTADADEPQGQDSV